MDLQGLLETVDSVELEQVSALINCIFPMWLKICLAFT